MTCVKTGFKTKYCNHANYEGINVHIFFNLCMYQQGRLVPGYFYSFAISYTKIISCMNKTTCKSDPFPTKLLFSHLSSMISIILHIINLCLTSGIFPQSCKSSIVLPLMKKTGLDQEILKNYRPVSNLSFLSKVIEKVISVRF